MSMIHPQKIASLSWRRLGLLAAALLGTLCCRAQYPAISEEVKTQSKQRFEIMEKNSDEAWAKALPIVKEWAAKGRPYIPWAAKPSDLPQASIPAFPGAFGGGMYSFGGRGGRVFVVTSLADRGPGTFRDALEAGGPRIVVFNVSGIIQLKERIRVRAPYITIAGNTAPGDGVCIAGDTVEIETHDVVIRHMRFRRGSTWVGDRNDSIGGNPVGNIMIDHVSASWGLDENMSMYRHMYSPPDGSKDLKLPTVNITIQNSIFSEALDRFHHAFGSTVGGLNSTFHHNLWACNSGRNPSVGMYGDFTFVNNVIFNWVHRSVDGGDNRSEFNVYNNYFKPGPATPKAGELSYRILKPEAQRGKDGADKFGKAYVNGNIVEGNAKVTANNWDGGVQLATKGDLNALLAGVRVDKPFPHAKIPVQTAEEAYASVLDNVGATLPKRDPVDTRVIEMVRSGQVTQLQEIPEESYTIVGSKKMPSDSYKNGIIVHPSQVGGYPEYKGTPYKDSDGDGLPDDWEIKHGLNPLDASDASKDFNGDGYTVIEDFINGMDPKMPASK